MKNFAAILLLLSAGGGAIAQDAQPYAGMQTREIKALSTEQVADLKAGRGMGLALAAELNGMPGPSHVLEMGEKLGLTQDQRARVQRLFDGMKSEAIPIGEKLLSQEAGLDREFATKRVAPASLKKATAEIGATQGELRNAHLKYHLATLEVLNPGQIVQYLELRGHLGTSITLVAALAFAFHNAAVAADISGVSGCNGHVHTAATHDHAAAHEHAGVAHSHGHQHASTDQTHHDGRSHEGDCKVPCCGSACTTALLVTPTMPQIVRSRPASVLAAHRQAVHEAQPSGLKRPPRPLLTV